MEKYIWFISRYEPIDNCENINMDPEDSWPVSPPHLLGFLPSNVFLSRRYEVDLESLPPSPGKQII